MATYFSLYRIHHSYRLLRETEHPFSRESQLIPLNGLPWVSILRNSISWQKKISWFTNDDRILNLVIHLELIWNNKIRYHSNFYQPTFEKCNRDWKCIQLNNIIRSFTLRISSYWWLVEQSRESRGHNRSSRRSHVISIGLIVLLANQNNGINQAKFKSQYKMQRNISYLLVLFLFLADYWLIYYSYSKI